MDISFVIPTLNEASTVRRAIAKAWKAGAAEVIVADGGSDDETLDIAHTLDCKVVESRPGRAIQQNTGAKASRGNVLLFQHADNWFETDAAEQISAALADPAVLSGAFRQTIEAQGFLYRLLEKGNAWRVRRRGMAYGDQGIFVRRDVFFELGGFPEVRLMEDVQLMKHLRRRARPLLLPGPLHVSARRWQRHGVIRQTLRNWLLFAAHRIGVSPDRLARYYARHAELPSGKTE